MSVGIDVGGTFTDVVVINRQTGAIEVAKVPSTPANPAEGFLAGLRALIERASLDPKAMTFLSHGTTIATNTLIEGKGATVGLLTTKGFRDVLEIAYQTRPDVYDVFYDKPRSLIPRRRCIGVIERIGPDGDVIIPLDESSLYDATLVLMEQDVEVVVVAFLHSYQNSIHEDSARTLITSWFPNLPVVLSSDISPEYREYPRTSTAVVNAVLLPRVGSYIRELTTSLSSLSVESDLHLMTSSGGVLAAKLAQHHPVHLVESGPAAGVIAATFLAERSGFKDLIAFDMGGTTAKAALVTDGVWRMADEFEVGTRVVALPVAARGQGYPVRTPVVEIVEVGSGGGSVAALDPGGALMVGPQSMGAHPGPACYGRGGTEPTLTDANLLLGRLNPTYFLGGSAPLTPALAEEVITRAIARPLGMTCVEAADAVIGVAVANMTAALELVSIGRGVDPRKFVLVATGGAGPMHAVAIASRLSIGTVVIPPRPGLASALGLLATDVRHDFSRSLMVDATKVAPDILEALFLDMHERALERLHADTIAPESIDFVQEADICYLGQGHELRVPVPYPIVPDVGSVLSDRFHSAHERAYGFASETERVRIMSLRLTALGRIARPSLSATQLDGTRPEAPRADARPVYFSEVDGFQDCQVFDRAQLAVGDALQGPAVIEQMDSTILLPPTCCAVVDAVGNLIVDVAPRHDS